MMADIIRERGYFVISRGFMLQKLPVAPKIPQVFIEATEQYSVYR
jgi:hypothetical protein